MQRTLSYLEARLYEPSSWAGLAACMALVTGKDPLAVSSAVTALLTAFSGLLAIFMAENKK